MATGLAFAGNSQLVGGMLRPILILVLLAGCSPTYSPDTYAATAVQQANKVEQGTIVGVRKVAVQATGTTGAVAGAAAGGIAGSQAPVGSALTTLGGTLVGGLVGTGIERATGDTTAFEYIVRKGNGEMVSVTQKDATALAIGQKVLVISGSQARIVGDYTVPVEPQAPVAEVAVVPLPLKNEPLPEQSAGAPVLPAPP